MIVFCLCWVLSMYNKRSVSPSRTNSTNWLKPSMLFSQELLTDYLLSLEQRLHQLEWWHHQAGQTLHTDPIVLGNLIVQHQTDIWFMLWTSKISHILIATLTNSKSKLKVIFLYQTLLNTSETARKIYHWPCWYVKNCISNEQ